MMSTELLHSYVSPILLNRLAEGDPIRAPETRTGDAVIALWPEGASSIAESTHLAATWAKELISGSVRARGVLPLKAGLAAGTITTSHVGDVNDRWQLFVIGEALTQMGEAQGRGEKRGPCRIDLPAYSGESLLL